MSASMKNLIFICLSIGIMSTTLHPMDVESGYSSNTSRPDQGYGLRRRLLNRTSFAEHHGTDHESISTTLSKTDIPHTPYRPSYIEECKSCCLACIPIATILGLVMVFAQSEK